MFKGIKTIIQVVSIWTPVLFWNFNADTATKAEIVTAFAVGGTIAVLTELAYRFINLSKN